MKIYSLYLTYRNIVRLKEILSVFLKYGFFNVVENSDLKKFIPFYKRFLGKKAKRYIKGGIETQLRMAFEELGPTFIKFGQMLSRREDLFGTAFVEEFSKLEDRANPVSFDILLSVINKQYKDKDAVFSFINPISEASASLALVHSAKLFDGREVVLKIKRPDVENTVQDDLILLKFLARFFEKHFPDLRYLRVSDVVSEFERAVKKELNFLYEVNNMEKMASIFSDVPEILIPVPEKQLCSKDIIVMQKVDSIKLSDKASLSQVEIDIPALLKKGLKAFLAKLFKEGIYHGDLHLGNIGITYDGRIVLYDFGNVGFLSKPTRMLIKDFLYTLVSKDYEGLTAKFLELELVSEEGSLVGIERELMDCFEYRLGMSLKQLDITGLIGDILEITRKHKVNLPSELAGFFRTMLYLETIGKTAIPDFCLSDLVSELFQESSFMGFNPKEAITDSIKTLNDLRKIATAFPKRIDKLLNKMINDKFTVDFYHMNLEPLTEEMKKSSNRISISLILASLIIGSSLVFTSDKGPQLFGYPLLGVVGFISSVILGFYLLFSIIRSKL